MPSLLPTPPLRFWALVTAAAVGCAFMQADACAMAVPATADVALAGVGLAPAIMRVPAPWWSGFGDLTLNAVERAGPVRSAQGSSERVAAYIDARVLSIRLAACRSLMAATERQLAIFSVAEPSATGNVVRGALMQRLAEAERLDRQLTGRFEARMQSITEQTGLAPQRLLALVGPALASAQVPHFGADPSDASAAGGEAPTRGILPAELMAREQAVRNADRLMQLRGLELEATRQRQTQGAASEMEVLEKLSLYLIEVDRLATAGGAAAGAWIDFHRGAGAQSSSTSRVPLAREQQVIMRSFESRSPRVSTQSR